MGKKPIILAILFALFISNVSAMGGEDTFPQKPEKPKTEEYPINQGESGFKMPEISMLRSCLSFLPPLTVFPQYGQMYSLNEGQSIFPVSWILTGLSAVNFTDVLIFNSFNNIPARETSYTLGWAFLGAAVSFDMIAGAYKSTENAIGYINYASRTEMKMKPEKYSYKDPFLAGAIGLVSGGALNFFAGVDTDSAIFYTIVDTLAIYVSPFLLAAQTGNSMLRPICVLSFGIAIIARGINLYTCFDLVDQNNREYFKQAVCPNSIYKIQKDNDRKEPLIAAGLAAFTGFIAPGSGNFYAGNAQAGWALMGTGLAGWIATFALPETSMDQKTKNILMYVALGMRIVPWAFDIISAPCNAAIYNAVHSGESKTMTDVLPVLSINPIVTERGGVGLNMACSF